MSISLVANALLQQDDRILLAGFLNSHDTSGWLDTLDTEARVRIGEYLKQVCGLDIGPHINPLQPLPSALERPTSAERREIISPDFPDSIDPREFVEWAAKNSHALSWDMDMFPDSDSVKLEEIRFILVRKLVGLVKAAKQLQILQYSDVETWTENMGLKALINILYHLGSLLPSYLTKVFAENDNQIPGLQ